MRKIFEISVLCGSLKYYFQITKVVTVLDATKKSEIECLHENLKNFSHLIAVGAYGGDCFLVHIGVDLPSASDTEMSKPPFCNNLCSKFQTLNQLLF